MNKQRIIVVGGGTAGWIAASLLSVRLDPRRWQVTIIESSAVPTVGVGEGSTPQLKSLLRKLSIDEKQFMTHCNATYKNGIRFKGWSTRPNAESYFHPFPSDLDSHTVPAFFYNSFMRRQGIDLPGHPDQYFVSAKVAEQGRVPVPPTQFPFSMQYGYHFDAGLFADLLKRKAVAGGVEYIDDTIAKVNKNADGRIASITGAVTHEADFFVDCTGFKSLLLQQSLNVDYDSFANNLKNDRAVVMQTPLDDNCATETTSTALSAGWAWRIPLTNRIGNGYVFSSSYLTDEQAEAEFREYLGIQSSQGQVRFLAMKVGQVKYHWYSNCLAVGLSQGFIEPLEATAIHLAQETVEGFIEAFNNGEYTGTDRSKFNADIRERFSAVRDYIVGHYKLSARNDSAYWRDSAQNPHLSQSLADVINCWTSGKNLSEEIDRQGIDKYYPSASWHCMLAGYGLYPPKSQLSPATVELSQYDINYVTDFIERCASNYARQHQAISGEGVV